MARHRLPSTGLPAKRLPRGLSGVFLSKSKLPSVTKCHSPSLTSLFHPFCTLRCPYILTLPGSLLHRRLQSDPRGVCLRRNPYPLVGKFQLRPIFRVWCWICTYVRYDPELQKGLYILCHVSRWAIFTFSPFKGWVFAALRSSHHRSGN